MAVQLSKHTQILAKQLAAKEKKQVEEYLLNLLLAEYKHTFKKNYLL